AIGRKTGGRISDCCARQPTSPVGAEGSARTLMIGAAATEVFVVSDILALVDIGAANQVLRASPGTTLIGRNAGPLAVLESGWAPPCPPLPHLAARASPAAWCRRRIRLTVPLIALAMAFALFGGNEGGTGRQECPDEGLPAARPCDVASILH